MEYLHDVTEAKDPSPANSSMLNVNSKFVDDNSTDENESFELIETPKNVVSITRPKPCYDFSRTVSSYSAFSIAHHNIAERSNYSSCANTSIPDVNSLSEDNPSDSDESFEFINDASDNVIETKTRYGPQNVSPVSLLDTEESNYSLTTTASTPNASFPCEDNSTYDESFELINETSEDLVYVTKSEKLYATQNISPNSTSNLESHCDIAEDKKFPWSANVSTLDMNSLSIDSNESFELINKTPEKVLCAKDAQQFYSLQKNVSSSSISNMESVDNTVFEKKCSPPVEECANDDKPKQESKILALIAERKKVSASKNIPKGSERICADGLIMEGLIKGIKNCGIAEKEFIAANKKHNDQFKANVLMHDERPNPESKNLFHVAKKRHVSIPANVCKYDKEMCSDMMKKVTKGIENCSIVDKQFNSNIAFDKKYSDEIKINPIVNKCDLVLPKNNLTSINASVEKYELKCSKTCMIAKGRKRYCDELFCLPYDDISDGEKEEEKVRAEEFLSCRPLNILGRPEIPEAVYILRSDCLSYLKKLRRTSDDKSGFRSEFSVYCSEEGNRIAQESKMRDLAKKLKDKMRKKPTKNSALKWAIEKKNIFSWRGFHIDF
ncbi:hypothetical protein AVEN_196674-1 [Araneus ventricosus]|uniref:Uncharacterized protein n=1 Tax=Araneus ventricosus TaxID=182803 RepID=A0A4Y2KR04_ARAVE|nr:hypothetical protein AVEN_196674-1 [Araneus ventricosus]